MDLALTKMIDEMKSLLTSIATDLKKAAKGNRAAAQRVRVDTIELEKMAKAYRRESIAEEKKNSHKLLVVSKKASAKRITAKMPQKK